MRTLSPKQMAAAVIAALLGVGIVALAAASQLSLATALTGLAITLGTISVVSLHQKVGQLLHAQASASEKSQEIYIKQAELLKSAQQQQEATRELRSDTLAAVRPIRENTLRIDRRQRQQVGEVEALLQLYRELLPRAPMPPSGGWALHPTELLELMFLIGQKRPKLVLELGGGTSTIWLAYRLEQLGGTLISVDHDLAYADRTTTFVSQHQLSTIAEIRHAPLREVPVGDEQVSWYDPAVLADLHDVDLLLVDGPPGATGRRARFPALPLLEPALSDRATVVLDDADRPDESEIVQRWLAETPGLVQELSISLQHAILSYSRSGRS